MTLPTGGHVLRGLAFAGVAAAGYVFGITSDRATAQPLPGTPAAPAPQPGQAQLLQRAAGAEPLGPVEPDAAPALPPVRDGGHVAEEEGLVHGAQCGARAPARRSQTAVVVVRAASKLASGLPEAWWSSTARTLAPVTSADSGRVKDRTVRSAVPVR